MRRSWTPLVTLVAVVAVAAPSSAIGIEGYVYGSAGGRHAYADDRAVVDVAGVDGVVLMADADGISRVGDGARAVLHAAHRHGDTAELLVSNYSGAIGDFDPALAHTMLTAPRHRRHVAAALAHVVRRDGWDGVQVDLESLGPGDRDGLVAFVHRLRADLPRRARISMAVMSSPKPQGYAQHGYALGRLGDVNRFVLMAYDEHGPGWSGPGPVGALPWVRTVLHALLQKVDRRRVDLGIAGYGYRWTDSGGHTVSDRGARRLAGDRAVWHPKAGEWSARLPGGDRLWWSDARSYRLRLALAKRRGLHGVAVWQLGSADPLTR